MKKILLSLASVALSTSAFAAVPTDQWSTGELMIGFYSAVEDKSLTVNLGSFEQFALNDGATTSLSIVNTADLVSVYGANWATRTDLTWTVTGAVWTSAVNGLTRNTVFATTVDGNTAIVGANETTLVNDRGDIQGLGLLFNSTDTLSNGSTVVIDSAASNVNSFYSIQANTPNARFGPQNNGIVGTNSVLDLYGLVPTSGTGAAPTGLATDGTGLVWARGTNALGSFTLNNSGLSFTATSAIPEPASFAAIGGLAVLGLAASRRRRVQA